MRITSVKSAEVKLTIRPVTRHKILKHHRPLEFTVRLRAALKLFLDEKGRDGLRPRTQKALKASIERFFKAVDDPWTHKVTHQQVEVYLRGLRSAEGQKKASKKFWNNTLNDLKGFFTWSAAPDKATNRPFTFKNPSALDFSSLQRSMSGVRTRPGIAARRRRMFDVRRDLNRKDRKGAQS